MKILYCELIIDRVCEYQPEIKPLLTYENTISTGNN
jgi:hypothetical protein